MKSARHFLGAALVIAGTLIAREGAAAEWRIIPEESGIEFSGKQMGVPTSGSFTTFEAEIEFDRDAPSDGHVGVDIDVASVTAPYPVLAQVLKTEPWFNAEAHPIARFESSTISGDGNGGFIANGELTLRGITQRVTLAFTFDAYGADPARPAQLLAVMTGQTTVQRTAFGVGQGEWGDISIVDDDVTIQIRLRAETAAP